jgi:chemotaxis response regulator CheB
MKKAEKQPKIAKKIKVLIVEDSESMRTLLYQVFEKTFQVEISRLVKNSAEARLEVSRRKPDLVLLDEILPGESSLDLLQDLSEEKIPVILITALEDAKHELPSQALGRLNKPQWTSDENSFQKVSQDFENQILSLLSRSQNKS